MPEQADTIQDLVKPLRAALAEGNAVLEAEPGAGKSTVVPLELLGQDWLGDKRILMLEPRRLAARAVAERLAHNLGEPLGTRIGLSTRDDQIGGKAVRIEVVTEGLLTRRLQQDAELGDVGLIIFDEAHERSLHTDLALTLCLDCQDGLRPDLRLLLMSATVDRSAVSRVLNDAPILFCKGRQFPVDIHWRPQPKIEERAIAVASTVCDALSKHEGDVLVFLPGNAEIRQVQKHLSVSLPAEVEVVSLHGSLSGDNQRKALLASKYRRVTLSTAIAETSVTLPGVRVVVDLGLERRAQFDPVSGVTQLRTLEASQASATQRAGRAGRIAPGACYRLWSENGHTRRASHWRAEILDADLSDLLLQLRAWGVRDPNSLRWQDPPSTSRLSAAETLLTQLGVLNSDGHITTVGSRLSQIGLPVRLACLAYLGYAHGVEDDAIELASLLAEAPGGEHYASDYRQMSSRPSVHRLQKRLGKQLRSVERLDVSSFDSVLLRVFADRIGIPRPNSATRYQLSNGLGVRLLDEDPLAGSQSIVAFDLGSAERSANRDTLIRRARLLNLSTALADCPDLIQTDRLIGWDENAERVVAQERTYLGKLLLAEKPIETVSDEEWCEGLLDAIESRGLDTLPWTDAARQLQARVAFVRQHEADESDLPSIDDQSLLDRLADWLAPHLTGYRSLKSLSGLSMVELLRDQLSWSQKQQINEMAPNEVDLPSGRSAPVSYSETGPILAVKLQEVFGWTRNPVVANGRVPISLHLLSPAGRPVAVTSDIDSFWSAAYQDVRKEMRGRYPKHPWPEDPRTAEATALTKRGMTRKRGGTNNK